MPFDSLFGDPGQQIPPPAPAESAGQRMRRQMRERLGQLGHPADAPSPVASERYTGGAYQSPHSIEDDPISAYGPTPQYSWDPKYGYGQRPEEPSVPTAAPTPAMKHAESSAEKLQRTMRERFAAAGINPVDDIDQLPGAGYGYGARPEEPGVRKVDRYGTPMWGPADQAPNPSPTPDVPVPLPGKFQFPFATPGSGSTAAAGQFTPEQIHARQAQALLNAKTSDAYKAKPLPDPTSEWSQALSQFPESQMGRTLDMGTGGMVSTLARAMSPGAPADNPFRPGSSSSPSAPIAPMLPTRGQPSNLAELADPTTVGAHVLTIRNSPNDVTQHRYDPTSGQYLYSSGAASPPKSPGAGGQPIPGQALSSPLMSPDTLGKYLEQAGLSNAGMGVVMGSQAPEDLWNMQRGAQVQGQRANFFDHLMQQAGEVLKQQTGHLNALDLQRLHGQQQIDLKRLDQAADRGKFLEGMVASKYSAGGYLNEEDAARDLARLKMLYGTERQGQAGPMVPGVAPAPGAAAANAPGASIPGVPAQGTVVGAPGHSTFTKRDIDDAVLAAFPGATMDGQTKRIVGGSFDLEKLASVLQNKQNLQHPEAAKMLALELQNRLGQGKAAELLGGDVAEAMRRLGLQQHGPFKYASQTARSWNDVMQQPFNLGYNKQLTSPWGTYSSKSLPWEGLNPVNVGVRENVKDLFTFDKKPIDARLKALAPLLEAIQRGQQQ